MKINKYGIIDMETGEIIEEKVLFIGRNAKYIDKGYIKVFTAFLSDVIETDEIAGKAIRLLFYMMENMDFNTLQIKIIPKHAIERLRISRRTYNLWINDLVKFGIIRKIDTYTYELKPYSFIKGSHTKALEKSLSLNELNEEITER